jgi:uracil-DNA glycosylase
MNDKREVWSAAPLIPERPTLAKLRSAAKGCTACPLWKTGTQTVFGTGTDRARMILVGEQPGNEEDLAGEPFIGPAGKLLDKCLNEAGIDRAAVYVTNAVKHFKWEPSGKRRVHKKPSAREIAACRPWLEAEIETLQPSLIVCLGATAAQTLLGRDFRVTQRRGEIIETENGRRLLATVHPSSILRAPDSATRASETELFIKDLRRAAEALRAGMKRD